MLFNKIRVVFVVVHKVKWRNLSKKRTKDWHKAFDVL